MYVLFLTLLSVGFVLATLLPFAALLAAFVWLAYLGNAWAIVPMLLLPWSLYLARKR